MVSSPSGLQVAPFLHGLRTLQVSEKKALINIDQYNCNTDQYCSF